MMVRWSGWRRAALAAWLVPAGCAASSEGPYCQWEEDEVDLDWNFGRLGTERTPRKVLEGLTRRYRGTLTWGDGGAWFSTVPTGETTGFTSQVSYEGRVRWRRDPTASGGKASLDCQASLLFDTTISMTTADGLIDDTWPATIDYVLSGYDGVTHDFGPVYQVAEDRLQIEARPDAPRRIGAIEYRPHLSWLNLESTHPEANFVHNGWILLVAELLDEQTGEPLPYTGLAWQVAQWQAVIPAVPDPGAAPSDAMR